MTRAQSGHINRVGMSFERKLIDTALNTGGPLAMFLAALALLIDQDERPGSL
jgi:hypothetical protein